MTEKEIRAAFREAWEHLNGIDLDDMTNEAGRAADELFDLMEFRRSETARFDQLLSEARESVQPEYDAVTARLRDAYEEAVVRFVKEHPDAPLAEREKVTA